MTQIQMVLRDFLNYLHTPLLHSHELKIDAATFQEGSIEKLLEFAANNRDQLDEILQFFDNTLEQDIDIFKKGITCLLSGTMIEMGGTPEIIVDTILSQLKNQLSLAESFLAIAQQENLSVDSLTSQNLDYLFACDSDAAKGYIISPFVVLAAMTSICRVKNARKQLRMDSTLVNQVFHLEEEIDHLSYLKQVIYSVDDMEIIVLHPESQTGLRLKADMIQNNFHFFTLLQDSYLNQFGSHPLLTSYTKNDTAISLAKGTKRQEDIDDMLTDHALFGFYDFEALQMDGKLPPSVSPANWLFGEGTPYHIPQLGTTPIVLLGENSLRDRSWDISFCTPVHEALNPNLEILEIFSAEQVQQQIASILAHRRETNE